MSQLLKILSLRQHGIIFNNVFDGLLADFNVGHSARIPTALMSQCVCQQASVGISFKFAEELGQRHSLAPDWLPESNQPMRVQFSSLTELLT